jgi:thiol-disulfide isomerase/thioredoxin
MKKLTLFLLLLLAMGTARPVLAQTTHPRTLPLGAAAPPFNLPGVDGHRYSLKDFAHAKVLVVIFTCNHCPTAQAYEDRIQQLVADYRPKGVAFVAINPNNPDAIRLDELGYTDLSDSFAAMKTRARARHFTYPYLYDGATQAVARQYGPVATPHAFVFDADRRLRYVGRIDDSERPHYVRRRDLRNALDALLAAHPVPVPQTPVFGCSIKWAGKETSVRQYLKRLATEPVTVQQVGADGLKALRKNDSGKLRLVNFWATWCGPCVAEFPELVTINRMYRLRAFEFVTVAANFPDEQNQVLAFLRKQQASNRNLLFGDPDKYKLMAAFDPTWNGGLPYTVLIAPSGRLLYRSEGEIDPLALKRLIVKSLKEDRF